MRSVQRLQVVVSEDDQYERTLPAPSSGAVMAEFEVPRGASNTVAWLARLGVVVDRVRRSAVATYIDEVTTAYRAQLPRVPLGMSAYLVNADDLDFEPLVLERLTARDFAPDVFNTEWLAGSWWVRTIGVALTVHSEFHGAPWSLTAPWRPSAKGAKAGADLAFINGYVSRLALRRTLARSPIVFRAIRETEPYVLWEEAVAGEDHRVVHGACVDDLPDDEFGAVMRAAGRLVMRAALPLGRR